MPRLALIAVVVALALLAGSQLVLPAVAERRIADELGESGDVRRVSVRAVPALKLLAGRADRVEVEVATARIGAGRLAAQIARADGLSELDVRVGLLQVGPVELRELRLVKRGDELEGEAGVSTAALAAALPPAIGFRPVGSEDGSLLLEATAGLLGFRATVRARLSARDGALVVAPEGGLLGGLATLTVFRDRRLSVTAIGARETETGYALSAAGRLNR